ncbi:hypothetical protein J2T03_001149 [Chryseobacterium lathyri]|nr:hypothetical protein [Chryseobacterium lathyri]
MQARQTVDGILKNTDNVKMMKKYPTIPLQSVGGEGFSPSGLLIKMLNTRCNKIINIIFNLSLLKINILFSCS